MFFFFSLHFNQSQFSQHQRQLFPIKNSVIFIFSMKLDNLIFSSWWQLSISNFHHYSFITLQKPHNFTCAYHGYLSLKHYLLNIHLHLLIQTLDPTQNWTKELAQYRLGCPSLLTNSFSMLAIIIIYWLHFLPIQMSEDFEKQKSMNEQKKKTRRTRKDEQGRNFTCPCGKSYLSYPALYTHTKTKHQGKAPRDNSVNQVKEPVEEQNQNKDPIGQLKELIDKYFPGNDQQAYPTPLLQEESDYIDKIIDNWEQNKQSKIEDPSNNFSETVNIILGRFLCEMKSQVNLEGYLYLCDLICTLHQAITEWNKDKNYFTVANASNLCACFNQFLESKYGKKGSPVNNSILTSKVLQYLGVWMFQLRYTNSVVKFTPVS